MIRTCFHHRDRETGRSCTRCERPACYECLRDAPVGAHCFECVKAAQPPARERMRRWNATAGPLVTNALILLNVAVFVLTAGGNAAGSNVEGELVLYGPMVAVGEWHRLLTSGFVHFGLIHLGFNMLLLYRFGGMLERELGRVRFGALYLCALLGGSLGVVLLSPRSFTGGASGAVFGLVGAAALGVRQRGMSVWESGIGGLLALNLFITFTLPGISIGGHVGGLVAGAACGAFLLQGTRSLRSTLEGAAFAAALSLAAAGASVVVAVRAF